MLALILLSACTGKYTSDRNDDDTGYAYKDTSPLDDTAPDAHDSPVDSVDSVVIDSDTHDSPIDSTPVDDTGTVAPEWLSLQVWPASIVVEPTATWALQIGRAHV